MNNVCYCVICYKTPYSVLKDSDLTHVPKAQRPVLIMKHKLTRALRSQPVGSVPVRKGPHCFQTKGAFIYGFQFGAHPGMPKCNRTQDCLHQPAPHGIWVNPDLQPRGIILSSALLLVWCLQSQHTLRYQTV